MSSAESHSKQNVSGKIHWFDYLVSIFNLDAWLKQSITIPGDRSLLQLITNALQSESGIEEALQVISDKSHVERRHLCAKCY